jgi:radical SAM superfamily enzyme YgiQ (UPF0313 family)
VVDFVINGPGERAFPALLDALKKNEPYELIHNLIYRSGEQVIKTARDELYDPDELPSLPYEKLNRFYPLRNYLGKTYLGSRTIAYHSSMGCPFKCSFCAVVPIYNARWKGKSAQLIYNDIKYLKENYGGNAIEFHDNNFFVSEKRTVEFSKLIKPEKMTWWGEGRIDTIDKYSDESLALMRESGCKMIFFGAETGNDEILKKMDKGGTQTAAGIPRKQKGEITLTRQKSSKSDSHTKKAFTSRFTCACNPTQLVGSPLRRTQTGRGRRGDGHVWHSDHTSTVFGSTQCAR